MKYTWKDHKKFAFTIVDDTDGASVENIKPIYQYLYKKGIITTKTVWMYSPRDYFPGDSMENEAYRDYVVGLQKQGYELVTVSELVEAKHGETPQKGKIYGYSYFK